MSKNIKFPPSQFGTIFEGVRSRKWRALHREKFVVDIGVHATIQINGIYCFLKFERPINLSGIYLIIKSTKVSRVRETFLDRYEVSPYIKTHGHQKVYAVFDSKNDYALWKLKNV